MNKEQKDDIIKFSLIGLIVMLLFFCFFLYKYANSEGFKCLKDPMAYALNHTVYNLKP